MSPLATTRQIAWLFNPLNSPSSALFGLLFTPSRTRNFCCTVSYISSILPKSQNPNYSRHMDYGKLSIGNPGLLFLFLAGVFYLFVWSSTLTNPFSAFQESHCRLPNTVSFPAYIFLQTNMGDLNFSKEIRLKYFILADPDWFPSRRSWRGSIQSFNGKQNGHNRCSKQGLHRPRHQSRHHHAWPVPRELLARREHQTTAWPPLARRHGSDGLRPLPVSTLELL